MDDELMAKIFKSAKKNNGEVIKCINKLWACPKNIKKLEIDELRYEEGEVGTFRASMEVESGFLCSVEFIDILSEYKAYLKWNLLKENGRIKLVLIPRG